MELILECSPEYLGNTSKIFVNGNWIGVIDKPLELVKMLKLYRRNGIIPTFTSISFNYQNNEINIFTDVGRLTRPIYYIEDGNLSFNREDVTELFTKGKFNNVHSGNEVVVVLLVVVLVDVELVEVVVVAAVEELQ